MPLGRTTVSRNVYLNSFALSPYAYLKFNLNYDRYTYVLRNIQLEFVQIAYLAGIGNFGQIETACMYPPNSQIAVLPLPVRSKTVLITSARWTVSIYDYRRFLVFAALTPFRRCINLV